MSKTLQDNELFITGNINLEPYASVKKKNTLEMDEPSPNIYFWLPVNCWETDPIKTMVSRYTWGFANVIMKSVVIIENILPFSYESILIFFLLFTAEINLVKEYIVNQMAEIPNK